MRGNYDAQPKKTTQTGTAETIAQGVLRRALRRNAEAARAAEVVRVTAFYVSLVAALVAIMLAGRATGWPRASWAISFVLFMAACRRPVNHWIGRWWPCTDGPPATAGYRDGSVWTCECGCGKAARLERDDDGPLWAWQLPTSKKPVIMYLTQMQPIDGLLVPVNA